MVKTAVVPSHQDTAQHQHKGRSGMTIPKDVGQKMGMLSKRDKQQSLLEAGHQERRQNMLLPALQAP